MEKKLGRLGAVAAAAAGAAVAVRMVGIPDGLGAYDNGDGMFTVLMNHELGATSGIVREHGSRGAFVSKWTSARTRWPCSTARI